MCQRSLLGLLSPGACVALVINKLARGELVDHGGAGLPVGKPVGKLVGKLLVVQLPGWWAMWIPSSGAQ